MNISEGLSLRQWFYLHARIPLFIAVLTFLSVELLLLAVVGKNQLEHQRGVAERLGSLSQLAIQQKSTALLQTAFDIATKELGAKKAYVCEKSLVYALRSPQMSQCLEDKILGFRTIEVPLETLKANLEQPLKNYLFVLQVPIFPKGSVIYYTLGLSLLVCALGLFLLYRMGKKLEEDLFRPLFKNFSSEAMLPIRELEEIRKKLLSLATLKTQEAINQALIARNAQVAHDIKSPLTALLFASKDFELLPHNSRNVIGTAVRRISAIVDSLTESKKTAPYFPTRRLVPIVRELFQEKKAEYANKQDVQWVLNLEESEPESASPISEHDLKRVLSNLINNAIEALINQKGSVELGASSKSGTLEIWVRDSGRGMTTEVLSRLGEAGFTLGKQGGKGLGFSFAKRIVEQAGGKIQANSSLGNGSEIKLIF